MVNLFELGKGQRPGQEGTATQHLQNLPENVKTNCENISDGDEKSSKRGCTLSDNSLSLSSTESKGKTVGRSWSKCDIEFDEMVFIAGGGFGKVFKARHKLDCTEYAIKRIKIKSTKMTLCTLAEVRTIAKLTHPNIVSYKTAWLEPYFNDTLLKSDSNAITEQESSEGSSDKVSSSPVSASIETSNKSSDFIQFERSGNEPDARECSNETSQNCDNRSLEVFRQKSKRATLYIQMSLCQLTLKEWLNERDASPNFDHYYTRYFGHESDLCHVDIVNDIFNQTLSGLNYLHSKNIVHHDIKPSNIFVGKEHDGKLIVQIGDFGLSCSLRHDGNNNLLEDSFQNNHTNTAVGTPLYAAPEQLKGQCNPKSDIYSLGIVSLELLLKFDTGMERVCTIEKARRGNLPSELDNHSMKLLKRLLSDVKVRPTTKDLLESKSLINLEQNLRALKITQPDEKFNEIQIKNLKKQIHILTEKMEEKERQVKKLKVWGYKKDITISKLKTRLRRFRLNKKSKK